MTITWKKSAILLAFCAASVLFILMLAELSHFAVDDSFIYFRYADNVAAGRGFVFNPGEVPGEGFTSWIWLLLLALGKFLRLNPLLFSKVLGVLFLGFTALIAGFISRRINGAESGNISQVTGVISAAVVLLNYRYLAHAVSGMETFAFSFFLMALVWFTTRPVGSVKNLPRWLMGFSLAATGCFLCRPEGLIVAMLSLGALVLINQSLLSSRTFWFAVLAGFVLPVGLFILWKSQYFGTLFPLSFYHKFIFRYESTSMPAQHLLLFLKDYGWLVISGLATGLFCLFRKKQKIFLHYISMFALMSFLYLWFYPSMNYLNRFYIPYSLLLLILVSPAISHLLKKSAAIRIPLARATAVSLLVLLLLGGFNFHIAASRKTAKFWSKIVNPEFYRGKLGTMMGNLPRDTVVANTEMGVIPYYSGLTCIDMAGLTDPRIARSGLSLDYLTRRKTDLILFPRAIQKMTDRELRQLGRNYYRVFSSIEFRKKFKFAGSFAAWPGKSPKYYFYLNAASPKKAAIEYWLSRYTKKNKRRRKNLPTGGVGANIA